GEMETARAPAAPATSRPRTVEAIFRDFSARRSGLVRALTSDVDDFFDSCDPDKENLCLYGHPDGTWEVSLPAEEVPPELPEPALGINFARNGMNRRDWLSLVAVHSDSWLLSVAFFFGAPLTANERKRLFSMINDLPNVYESMVDRKHRDRSGVDSSGKSRHSSKPKRTDDVRPKNSRAVAREEDEDEDEEEHSETFCGSCTGIYNASEFWIGCDMCERWFHGKCVRITPAKADHIKHYKCPECSSSKKMRQ
uniref:PHD finger protein ALFIN-LIKE n=3 Tax=Triticinae TaxID=1648030 RepID=A0A453M8Y9_AEGTS